MASTDSRPIPQKNVAYRVVFPILDADGDLVTGATGLDSEVSKDQGTFADCTNEATEIATASGMYYLDLTSTEMNADCVAIIVKTSSSGAKTTPIVLYPEEAGDIRVNVTQFGSTNGTFSAGRPEVNTTHLAGTSQTGRDIGASVLLSSGTGTGQVTLTSGRVNADVTHVGASAITQSGGRMEVNTTHAAGTAWGSGAITAGAIASDAITAAKIADGALDRATFAADTGLQSTRSNTAQAGAAGTITLDASASSVTDFYKGMCIYITGGTGAGQGRVCTAYNGTTKVATITPNWATNPDNTSTFAVMETAGSDLRAISGTAVSTSSAQLGVNVVNIGGSAISQSSGVANVNVAQISGDSVAADNAESFFDGTGYAGTNNVIPTVTTLTNAPSDSSGVTTLLSRLTSARAGYLDVLNGIVAAIWAAVVDSSGVTTLLSRLSSGRASNLDNLDATVSSRLASASYTSPPTAAAVADQVWEEALTDHSGTSGSTAAALNAAGSAGDPWNTALPGSYGAGTAGKILGDNLNATVSSRASQTSVDTVAGYIDTEVAAIKAKTDNLPASPANEATLTTIAGYIDTEVAAIKAKTDNLPAAPAATSDCITAAGVRSAIGLASANLDTQLDALPTNPELATALGTADDATLAAIAALNNLSSAQVQTAAAAALTAYDPPTRAEATADKDAIITEVNANETKIDAVKAKTDSLTFTISGQVDANIQSVNDVAVTGDGQPGTEWGPV